ncbi:hypothetical protein BY458DRAFT_500642 [Sporodiniella umbellata]|nr:hypothetical protein BY458DRAFT_500642 [Sporodiniella umbellata]
MSLRSVITATRPFQNTLKIQSSRFGTLSLFANNAVIRNDFQIPSWLEAFLWAAPKKKTSHSKKRMRASNKGLKQKENITACPTCGSNKLLHHLCPKCYSDIKKKTKAELA